MTADNASAVLVRRAGAWSVPTFYLSTAVSADAPSVEYSPPPAARGRATSVIRFHYASEEDWRSQFVDRPLPTEQSASALVTAVVERTPVADRLLMLVAPPDSAADALDAHVRTARNAGRDFFHVTTSAELAHAARSRGLSVRAGHLMVQDIAAEPALNVPRCAAWHVHSGDRM
jgi:hypothetical protein